MQGELASSRHRNAQIEGFKGLLTNLADYRAIPAALELGGGRMPTGFLGIAQDVVFDEGGNARPRDGYEPWWPAMPQRLQLADMQPGEVTWALTGTGTLTDDTLVYYNGVQSKKLVVTAGNNATVKRTYAAAPKPMGVLKANTGGQTTGVWAALRIAGLANVSQIDMIMVTSVGTFTYTHLEYGFVDSVWKSVNLARHTFTAAETVTSVAIKVTAGGGVDVTVNFADWYLAVENAGGSAPGTFLTPDSLAVDALDNIYVTDATNHRVQKFNNAGTFLFQFGSLGPGNGQFNGPRGIVLDSAGNIYVVDRNNNRVQKFDSTGKYLTQWGTFGTGNGQFNAPWGIAVDGSDNIYVADNFNNRIQKFSSTGTFLLKFGLSGAGNGQLSLPSGLKVTGAGNIIVVDSNNNRIQTFDATGVYVSKFGVLGGGPSQFTFPVALALDGAGNMYVVDEGNSRLQKFDAAGVFVNQFGVVGTGNGQFTNPLGVILDSAGRIFITDANRVQEFTTTETWIQSIGISPYVLDSFCTGSFEWRSLTSTSRYLMAGFGETLYFDANEAKTPKKIISGLTRNAPLYFAEAENRAFWSNGLDPNFTWTGGFFRPVGYPAPTTALTLAAHAAAGNLTVGDYFYACSFVYGYNGVLHGESSLFVTPAAVTTSAGNTQVDISAIPVGAVGSGVVQRRIYRVTVNSPSSATFNLVQVIDDNTTTTYTDNLADTALILQQAGAIDNGVPPVAKYMTYFSKGMVYMKGNQVWYSRPGVDLNSTPETVPSTNTFNLAPAGQITGYFEFNNTLYITQEFGVAAHEWVGSNLVTRPVLHSAQANVGCMDRNSIAIKGNDYVYWRDMTGQLQRMDINENITLVSKPVKNLLNNINNNLSNSISFAESFKGKGKFLKGSIGSNLSVGLDGAMAYTYQPIAGVVMGAQTVAFGGHIAAGNSDLGDGFVGNGTYSFVLTANAPLALSKIGIALRASPTASPITVAVSFAIYKISALNSYTPGAPLATGTTGFTWTSPSVQLPIAVLTNTIFIPNGESVIVQVNANNPAVTIRAGGNACNSLTASNVSVAPKAINIRLDIQPALKTVITSAVLDADLGLQRWGNASLAGAKLAGGNSITLQLDTDSTNPFGAAGPGNYHAQPPLVYYLQAIADSFPNLEPITNTNPGAYLYPLRDYRINDNNTTPGWTDVFPLPAPNPQQHYAKLILTLDPNRVSVPPNEACSRVSTDVTVSFPSITGASVNGSTEGSFVSPYNPADYHNDIYTSEVITAQTLLAKLGSFDAVFQKNQQNLIFQIRTGTSSGAIAGNAWNTVQPNAQIPATAMNDAANDVCFQVRVMFQDDPSQQGTLLSQSLGTPSVIFSIGVSWLGANNPNFIYPAMPASLVFYKDRIVGSWATLESALLNQTLCMDWYVDDAGALKERFATWTGIHFCSFALSNGKLIGGGMVGGQLYRLFNSAIGDGATVWPGAFLSMPGIVATVPHSFGSSSIKTMMGAYVGLELNAYALGYVKGPLNSYPTVTDGLGNTAVPAFSFSLSTNPAGNGLVNAVTPALLGDTTVSQIYQALLSHASVAPNNQASQFKPYQNEYFFDVGEQERAFVLAAQLQAYQDSNGNHIFPSLTGFGVEFYLENFRGV